MVAGLESDVHGRPAGAIASSFESYHLSVGFAVSGVVAFADDGTVANDNSADHRVRRCLTPPLLGEGERATHVLCVALVVRTRIELRPIRRFWNRLLACH